MTKKIDNIPGDELNLGADFMPQIPEENLTKLASALKKIKPVKKLPTFENNESLENDIDIPVRKKPKKEASKKTSEPIIAVASSASLTKSEVPLENLHELLIKAKVLHSNVYSLAKKEATKKKVAALRWVKRSLPNVEIVRVSADALLCDPIVFHSDFDLHLRKKEEIRSRQAAQLYVNIEKGRKIKELESLKSLKFEPVSSSFPYQNNIIPTNNAIGLCQLKKILTKKPKSSVGERIF